MQRLAEKKMYFLRTSSAHTRSVLNLQRNSMYKNKKQPILYQQKINIKFIYFFPLQPFHIKNLMLNHV